MATRSRTSHDSHQNPFKPAQASIFKGDDKGGTGDGCQGEETKPERERASTAEGRELTELDTEENCVDKENYYIPGTALLDLRNVQLQ
ncbi:hypothetical protein ACJ72_06154 [Emergomyces africanus]|uniref:Uncharacterized protein n=1 Tax=Emergomyces africanus TaxID=1955775 RepID=A0A1B7NQH6_9EURO|nr:hypothetical protein ACJ72_06602 [Emergomyces africanus]OAX79527.1 hypothetical protein ACJ72_06154 [Emergomyces africanus]